MRPAALPENESGRLRALSEYKILDTLPEEEYDDITKIASEIMGTPTALLNLIDEERQEDIETVGGLVMYLAGRVPNRKEIIAHSSGIEFEVLEASPQTITRLRLYPVKK